MFLFAAHRRSGSPRSPRSSGCSPGCPRRATGSSGCCSTTARLRRRDPQFGVDLGFYVFEYPFWRYMLGVAFTATEQYDESST